MIRGILSIFSPYYPKTLVYMLQSVEYQSGPYLKWYWRTQNFSKVAKRRQLSRTKAALLLLSAVYVGVLIQILAGLFLIWLGLTKSTPGAWQIGVSLLLAYPFIWAHLIVVPLILGRIFIITPRDRKHIAASEKIFAAHQGIKIAVAGSYGKTSMKEMLLTVLSEGKKVAATPANKNVASSHAAFARSLKGDEDIVILEYGEGKPGDVAAFARVTHPTHAIITGLAPAHLDQYPTLAAAGEDIFSVAKTVAADKVFVNGDSTATAPFIRTGYHAYDSSAVLGWRVTGIKVDFDGTRFEMKKAKHTLNIHSSMLGRHQVGPLALVAALAMDFGLTKKQVEAGIANTQPFEHRLQPRLMYGAWVIDDTYNGNRDGIAAGLKLLAELPAKRKIYVTPGLVDQGVETAKVHREIGGLIAEAAPDVVVLMKNSVTDYIVAGMNELGFSGELKIETDPLNFYTNLDQVVAAGDVVVMQNDWTDNYN